MDTRRESYGELGPILGIDTTAVRRSSSPTTKHHPSIQLVSCNKVMQAACQSTSTTTIPLACKCNANCQQNQNSQAPASTSYVSQPLALQ
jgi:hypothetical protein